jgi:CubicO group peptidase (beta-lactamase class C family)
MLAKLAHCFAAFFAFTGFKRMDKRNLMMKKALLLTALTMLACSPAQTETPGFGNIQTALSKLDPYICDLMHETGVPGLAVAVVYQGRLSL